MKKVYVDDSNKVIIICSNCGFKQNKDVTKFKDTQKKLEVKCRCGEAYQFTIEFRKRYRKDVRLPGDYIIPGLGEKGGIIIREISMSGIRFECLNPHNIRKDDTLKVKFKLDDPKKSEIRKQVKVIWAEDRIIGAHYIEKKLYEKDLGFYMQI